ncbi:MAG: ABC transporter ATP-binding protein [Patescibacteria group bacterium]
MKKRSDLARVFLLVRPFWGRIFGISLLIVVLSGLNQLWPLINRSFIDLISTGQTTFFLFRQTTFLNLVLLLLAAKLLSTIVNRTSVYASSLLGYRLLHYLREIGFGHLLELPVGYFDRNASGKVMNKLSRGTDGIRGIISNLGVNFLPGAATAVVSIVVVSSINWRIGLSAIAMFVPFFYLRLVRFKKLSKLEKRQNRVWDREYSHFWEVMSNIRLVKTFATERYELNKLRSVADKLTENKLKMEKISNQGVLADILIDIWTVAIYAYIFFLGLSQQITIGVVVLLVSYVEMIKQPLWNLNWIFWEVKYTMIGVRDYFKILDEKPKLIEINQPIHLPQIRGKVELKNVWFKYPEKSGQDVFRGISFAVEPGKTLALVGKSGVGKTTIAHLLVRFFDPDKGQIALDGVDLRDLSFDTLRLATGLVMQESHLFNETIAENLRYGKPTASREEMEIACQVANADEFIKKLPKGLDTVIGERGVRLSGGQKQRLSIARTVLKNPKVLILDEATSALDSHSEMLVQDALWKLIKGRTTIIIAHRLSTVQKADEIIVLDQKKIAEQGTHDELIKKHGIYSSLHLIQAGQMEKLKRWDLIS